MQDSNVCEIIVLFINLHIKMLSYLIGWDTSVSIPHYYIELSYIDYIKIIKKSVHICYNVNDLHSLSVSVIVYDYM